ncbi:MAG TPA: cytochrome c [Tepidisphaeraceae bacterium]|nr:cytochrome c [Tepidisphaeraceae bacterium]
MSDEFSNLPKYTYAPRPPKFKRLPFVFVSLALILVVATWIPLVMIARARASVSPFPRVQIIQDMGVQPKYREQQSSDVFADGRADRPEIVGTVAWGRLDADDHYYRGYSMVKDPKTGKMEPKFFDGFPKEVKVDAALLKRGQDRFNIYCSACHGLDGYGHGTVNEIGLQLQNEEHGTWVQAADLTKDPVKSRPAGHIYNTINVGIRNMPPYGPQIPVHDRWAIVAYVRALQLAQDAPSSLVREESTEK